MGGRAAVPRAVRPATATRRGGRARAADRRLGGGAAAVQPGDQRPAGRRAPRGDRPRRTAGRAGLGLPRRERPVRAARRAAAVPPRDGDDRAADRRAVRRAACVARQLASPRRPRPAAAGDVVDGGAGQLPPARGVARPPRRPAARVGGRRRGAQAVPAGGRDARTSRAVRRRSARLLPRRGLGQRRAPARRPWRRGGGAAGELAAQPAVVARPDRPVAAARGGAPAARGRSGGRRHRHVPRRRAQRADVAASAHGAPRAAAAGLAGRPFEQTVARLGRRAPRCRRWRPSRCRRLTRESLTARPAGVGRGATARRRRRRCERGAAPGAGPIGRVTDRRAGGEHRPARGHPPRRLGHAGSGRRARTHGVGARRAVPQPAGARCRQPGERVGPAESRTSSPSATEPATTPAQRSPRRWRRWPPQTSTRWRGPNASVCRP